MGNRSNSVKPKICRPASHDIYQVSLVLLLAGLLVLIWQNLARSQMVSSPEETARTIVIDKLSVEDGTVVGEIHNRSSHTLRDVQLFIRHTWLWNDEFNPGKDDPGTSAYHTVPGDIPPGGTTRFKFTPTPPLPKLPTGYFETTVSIAGFTEVIPQSK
ncbi:MAG: hypothetical protein ACREQ7_12850 [Candidatus Binatia bacterium]